MSVKQWVSYLYENPGTPKSEKLRAPNCAFQKLLSNDYTDSEVKRDIYKVV